MPMTAKRPGSGPCLRAASDAAMRSVWSTSVSARSDNCVVVVVSDSRFSIPKRSHAATRSISRRWNRLSTFTWCSTLFAVSTSRPSSAS